MYKHTSYCTDFNQTYSYIQLRTRKGLLTAFTHTPLLWYLPSMFSPPKPATAAQKSKSLKHLLIHLQFLQSPATNLPHGESSLWTGKDSSLHLISQHTKASFLKELQKERRFIKSKWIAVCKAISKKKTTAEKPEQNGQ